MVLDVIGEIFWKGILATPLMAYLMVRKKDDFTPVMKFWTGLIIAIGIAIVFFFIAITIFLSTGLGLSGMGDL